MPHTMACRGYLWAGLLGLLAVSQAARADLPKVPEGFKIRLVAAVPAVQYPSQVATAPDGALFVGEDPMDQVGPADKPIDRVLLFRNGKAPVVFADKMNAIFGMVWHDGALYVMNMPHLTVLRDTDGDGKADQRKELFTDLGVPAGSPNDFNDHIVSGLKIGIDGYLYISTGDKGVPKATGRDGRTAQVVGGGILRCRPDGLGLEVFSTGTRNHLEPNLDPRDNLFTYDNTDDGLGWWTRVTHHIDGGYYGYPYDYHSRTDRMLPRMAEFGGGSPCGGVVYADDVWPEKYRGRIFWSEWGKRAVQAFRVEPSGASFKVADKIDFVTPGTVENFRPLDLALSHDGRTMYIADWSFGGWSNKEEKLGRVYAVTYDGADAVKLRPRGTDSDPVPALIAQLDHPSFQERRRAQEALIKRGKSALGPAVAALADPRTDAVAKRHLVWVVDGIAGATPEASLPLIEALKSASADVRAQAARALGERAVPLASEPLIRMLNDPDPAARLQAIIALGRIGDESAVPALIPLVAENDVYLAYSSRKALRRIGDWKAIARGLDSNEPRVREGVLLTLEQVYEPEALSALIAFVDNSVKPAKERARAVAFAASVHRKAPPWDGKWWGTQPAKNKPPARTIEWAGTLVVTRMIGRVLNDPSPAVRLAAVQAVAETRDRGELPRLRSRFTSETEPGVRREIARTLGEMNDRQALPLLAAAIRDAQSPQTVRGAALEAVETIGTDRAVDVLVDLLESSALKTEGKPTVIAALGRLKALKSIKPLIPMVEDGSTAIRTAAIDALAAIAHRRDATTIEPVSSALRGRLSDPSVEVQKRAISALGTLGDQKAIAALMTAAEKEETRFEATAALAAMPHPAALQVYLRGLGDKSPELRKAAATAIGNLRDQAAPVLEQLARRNELPPSIIPELRIIFSRIEPVTTWKVLGPFAIDAPRVVPPQGPSDLSASVEGAGGKRASWLDARLADPRGQVDLGRIYSHDDDLAAYGYAELNSPSNRKAQMVVGSDDTLTVWLNGKQVYEFADRRGFNHEQARFEVSLVKGKNRLLVRCGNRGGPWQFSAALTGIAEYAFLKGPSGAGFNPDLYRAEALKGQGKPDRGKILFSDLKGLACIKCHSVNKNGGSVGPELSSVGAKYPRDELITAVLYPSAKISSGYEPAVFALNDGRVFTGIVKNETKEAIEILDDNAKLIRIHADQIEERKRSDVSLMPNGLAQGISPQDFADLIGFLETLREVPAAGSQ